MKRTVAAVLLAAPLILVGCGAAKHDAAPQTTQAALPVAPAAGPVGSTGQAGDVAVTVMSVKLAKQANYPGGLTDPDYPQTGGFVVADVLEQNNGQVPVEPDGFYVQGDDGTRYDATVEPAFDPEIVQSGQGALTAGDKVRGKVVFDAPVQHGRIVYADGAYSWTF
jgi:hypothetical protein